ncbi:MAG: ABC transporter permease subunit [Dehalococcoidia bacterium]
MSFTLFQTTLKLNRWAIGSWAVFFILYGLMIVLLFPSIKETSGLVMQEYIESLPEGMLNAMGLTEDVRRDMFATGSFTLAGFLGTEYLNWWPLIIGIYAFMFGSGIIAREVERGTMEFLLSHPIPRYKVVVSKFVSFLAIVGILVVCSVLGIAAGLPIVGEDLNMARVFVVILQGGLVATAIAAYSLLISCIALDPRKAMAIAGGMTAGLYILNLIGPILGPFEWLQKLSLFYYFRPFEMLFQGKFVLSSFVVYLGITAACFAGALVVFQRRKAVV